MATPRPRDQATVDAEKAYQLSVRGFDQMDIAKVLSVHPRTAWSYIKKQRALIRKDASP